MGIEGAILDLVKGKTVDEKETLQKESSDLIDNLNKLASAEEMPENISELLKAASDIIQKQEAELEYIKIANSLANDGVIKHEDILSKAEEFKRDGTDPSIIKEAMKLGITKIETFGKASSDNTHKTTGMYSVLNN